MNTSIFIEKMTELLPGLKSLFHGSLLVMQRELQHFWQQQIQKNKKHIKLKINLTFRVVRKNGLLFHITKIY